MTKLMRGDCLDLMQELAPESIDMVMCDLPYGTTQNKWDTVIPLDLLWAQYRRICKPGAAVVLTAAQPFTSVLVMSNLREFKYQWVWDKVNRYTGSLNAKRMPLRRHEDILVFGKSGIYNEQTIMKPRMSGGGGGNFGSSCGASRRVTISKQTIEDVPHHAHTVLQIPAKVNAEIGLHPTQKPVALMEYLIKTYTHEGMTVLDNCMGSGTTGVACMNTNRNFIGMEQNAEYFAIAEQRIANASRSPEPSPQLVLL